MYTERERETEEEKREREREREGVLADVCFICSCAFISHNIS
jgi:hypothetical protein